MNCLRCGRALKNKKSAERGFGPSCYKKRKLEDIKDNADHVKEIDELDGQIYMDEIRGRAV